MAEGVTKIAPIGFRQLCAAFRRNADGATAMEFALVAPVLFFTLLSVIEIGMLVMASSNLDHAVAQVARAIRTGRAEAPASAGAFETQVCAVMGGDAGDCRDRLVASVQTFSRFADANAFASAQPAGQFDKGGAEDIVVVKANYKWPLITPLVAVYDRTGPLEVTLASRLMFKNEPYE